MKLSQKEARYYQVEECQAEVEEYIRHLAHRRLGWWTL